MEAERLTAAGRRDARTAMVCMLGRAVEEAMFAVGEFVA